MNLASFLNVWDTSTTLESLPPGRPTQICTFPHQAWRDIMSTTLPAQHHYQHRGAGMQYGMFILIPTSTKT